MSKYLVYGLVDPRSNMVRYIGKSSRGLVRPRVHGTDSHLKTNYTHRSRWIKELKRNGLKYNIIVLQECADDNSALEAEVWWIAYGRLFEWPLTNHTTGGESPVMDLITRQKQSKASKGKPKTRQHAENIANALRGRPKTQEHVDKVCGVNSPMKRPEIVAKRSETMRLAREKDPERYSIAAGKGWSPERKLKFSINQSGAQSHTKRPEVKAKISAVRKAQEAEKKRLGIGRYAKKTKNL